MEMRPRHDIHGQHSGGPRVSRILTSFFTSFNCKACTGSKKCACDTTFWSTTLATGGANALLRQHQSAQTAANACPRRAAPPSAPPLTPPPSPSPNSSSLKRTAWRSLGSTRYATRHATAPNPPLRPGEPRVNEAHRGDLRAPHLPPRALCRAQVCHPRLEPATALPPAATAALCSHRPPACADTS